MILFICRKIGKADDIHFRPYPSLNSFCWDPLGKLAIIRNLRYIDRKLESHNSMSKIYNIEQLNTYMVNCERKIRSENKLNILTNKDFMINDDEGENDFCIEFDTNVAEADDDDEVTDFLSFKMKKKKVTREDKSKEQENNEEDANDEYIKDYFPIPISNHDYEKRLLVLKESIDHSQASK